MLTLPEIEKFYPETLRGYKRFLIREYLQHKILQIIFDSVFLLSLIDQPNYDYLKMKLNITSAAELKKAVLNRCKEINMQEMATDVQPFLFNSADVKKVLLFPDFLTQVNLR